MSEDYVTRALAAIGKEAPKSLDDCIYKSGFVDSFELMQLVMELEFLSGVRLDLAALMSAEVSIHRLRSLIEG